MADAMSWLRQEETGSVSGMDAPSVGSFRSIGGTKLGGTGVAMQSAKDIEAALDSLYRHTQGWEPMTPRFFRGYPNFRLEWVVVP